MITARDIKRLGREFEVDLVGIGDMDCYEGAPAQMDPRKRCRTPLLDKEKGYSSWLWIV